MHYWPLGPKHNDQPQIATYCQDLSCPDWNTCFAASKIPGTPFPPSPYSSNALAELVQEASYLIAFRVTEAIFTFCPGMRDMGPFLTILGPKMSKIAHFRFISRLLGWNLNIALVLLKAIRWANNELIQPRCLSCGGGDFRSCALSISIPSAVVTLFVTETRWCKRKFYFSMVQNLFS